MAPFAFGQHGLGYLFNGQIRKITGFDTAKRAATDQQGPIRPDILGYFSQLLIRERLRGDKNEIIFCGVAMLPIICSAGGVDKAFQLAHGFREHGGIKFFADNQVAKLIQFQERWPYAVIAETTAALPADRFGNLVISKEFNSAMLAEAICKLEGFIYAPSDTVYWQQGHSTETDFIFVTTQTLAREQLQKLSDEVGEGRSLLVMCGAFRAKSLEGFPNLTVKKIPKAVLAKCEWGHDDYSLEIKNLPMKTPYSEEAREPSSHTMKPRSKAERRASVQTPSLFEFSEGREGPQ